jgi:hypothetical protein
MDEVGEAEGQEYPMRPQALPILQLHFEYSIPPAQGACEGGIRCEAIFFLEPAGISPEVLGRNGILPWLMLLIEVCRKRADLSRVNMPV